MDARGADTGDREAEEIARRDDDVEPADGEELTVTDGGGDRDEQVSAEVSGSGVAVEHPDPPSSEGDGDSSGGVRVATPGSAAVSSARIERSRDRVQEVLTWAALILIVFSLVVLVVVIVQDQSAPGPTSGSAGVATGVG